MKRFAFILIFAFQMVNGAVGQTTALQDSFVVKANGFKQYGKASYYANKLKNRKTASGEHYDPKGFTAAHRHLPFDTYVRVTNKRSGQSVIVKVNDRGPYSKKFIIDLSASAAKQIGITRKNGYAAVVVEEVERK